MARDGSGSAGNMAAAAGVAVSKAVTMAGAALIRNKGSICWMD